METRPEQVEVMMADIIDNQQLLQSLAQNVEQEEGRGKLKVSFTFMDRLFCLMIGVKLLFCSWLKRSRVHLYSFVRSKVQISLVFRW